MKTSLQHPAGRLLRLAAVALALGGCATGAARRAEAPREPSRLYGVAGNHLVRIDASAGQIAVVASSAELAGVGALTYDPGLDVFYAVTAGGGPRLIAVERQTGEVLTIGPIALPRHNLSLAEGLAFDPLSRRLYAAAGASAFASNLLLEVDLATAAATELGPIRGTAQDDVDAMALAGEVLYAVDSAGNSSALYRLDPETGAATAAGTGFPGTVAGLAYDASGRRLIAAVEGSRLLVALPLHGGETSTLGPIGDAPELGSAELTALAFADPVPAPLSDGFESGDLRSWSRHEPGGGSRDQR